MQRWLRITFTLILTTSISQSSVIKRILYLISIRNVSVTNLLFVEYAVGH